MKDTSELKNAMGDVHVELMEAKGVFQLLLEMLEPEANGAKGCMCELLRIRMVEAYIPAMHSVFTNILNAYQRVDEVL